MFVEDEKLKEHVHKGFCRGCRDLYVAANLRNVPACRSKVKVRLEFETHPQLGMIPLCSAYRGR